MKAGIINNNGGNVSTVSRQYIFEQVVALIGDMAHPGFYYVKRDGGGGEGGATLV
jgi:hypothetical protein